MRKNIGILLFAVCLVFTTCKNSLQDDFKNPNAGRTRVPTFSHDSGLYEKSFELSITALAESTIYYSTDGSIPLPEKVGNGYVFKYSSPLNVVNRNSPVQPNVLSSPANSTQMYGYRCGGTSAGLSENEDWCCTPGALGDRHWMQEEFIPKNSDVPKATVIRAMAVDSKGAQSNVVTKTFFIGNNLANYNNIRIVSMVSDPEGLVSEDTGILVRGHPNNRWHPWNGRDIYNFLQRGRENWEREAHLELFIGNATSRTVELSTGVGIRVRGNYSRGTGQKSLNMFFREEYGINNLKNYELIPGALTSKGAPIGTYKSVMFRNGGNEANETKYNDIFLQNLVNDRAFTTQAGVPVVMFLNGEYWGFFTLQERYSDNHTEYKFGVNRNNVIAWDNNELDAGVPGDEAYFYSMSEMHNLDMSNSANYEAFCKVFDIDSFIDYYAAQIYVCNTDWPRNNSRLWRTRNIEPGNPYGDTRWRYQMFDLDLSMGIHDGGKPDDNIENIIKGSTGDPSEWGAWQNHLFVSLMKNNDFNRQFVNTMMDLYNVNFHPDNWTKVFNYYETVYGHLMVDHHKRWGFPGGNTHSTVFQEKVNQTKRFFTEMRPAMTTDYLPKHFGSKLGFNAGSLRTVTISSTGLSGATVKINSVAPKTGYWTGQYYAGVPVTVTASAAPAGYEFDGWSVTNGTAVTPNAATTTVNLSTGSVTIIAKYKTSGTTVIESTGITLNNNTINCKVGYTETLTATIAPTTATYKTVIWTTSNSSVATVDNNGKITAVFGGTAVITASTLNNTFSASCTVTVQPQVEIDIFNLANVINGIPVGQLDNGWGYWEDNSTNTPLRNSQIVPVGGWDGEKNANTSRYSIINDGGKRLQVEAVTLWAPGVRLRGTNDSGIKFQAGDRIEIKAKFNQIRWDSFYSESFGVSVDRDPWPNIWRRNGFGDINHTIILTQQDVNTIQTNGLNIGSDGVNPWNGWDNNNPPQPISRVIYEQIRVYRLGYND